MKRVAALTGLLTVLMLTNGCKSIPRHEANWTSVEVGMTKEQVLELLGEPMGKSVPEEETGSGGESDPTRAAAAGIAGLILGDDDYWEYFSIETKGLSEEEIAAKLFEHIFSPLDQSYVVYFDQNGKVNKLRLPLKK